MNCLYIMTYMKEEAKKRADIYKCITDSFCCTAETNNIVNQLYSNTIFKK